MPQQDLIGMNYAGNAALGEGATDITINPKTDLNQINDTVRSIMMLDSERNIKLFSQKVNDRDNLTNRILSNEVSTGELDPGDQKFFDKAKSEVEKEFNNWGGNWNDTEGYRKYQTAVTHLQDVAAHGQTRWAMKKQLQQQKAAETLPHKQKQIQDFIDKQEARPFWDQIDPYQQIFSFDHQRLQDSLLGQGMVPLTGAGQPEFGSRIPTRQTHIEKNANGKITTVDKTTTLPQKQTVSAGAKAISGIPAADGLPPLFTSSQRAWDYTPMQRRATVLQIENGVDAENQNQWLGLVEGYDEPQKQKFVGAMNNRIAQYNQERGYAEGQKGFVNPVQLVNDPATNTTKINESAADFAAKTVLTGIDGNYVATDYSFNKDAADLRIKYDKLNLDKQKLAIDRFKAQSGRMNAETSRLNHNLKKQLFEKKTDDVQQVPQIWDEVIKSFTPVEISNPKDKSSAVTTEFELNADNIPVGFENFAGINEKGQAIRLEPKIKELEDGTKKNYYDVDFYIPAGTVINGVKVVKDTPINKNKLVQMYKKQSGDNPFAEGGLGDFIHDKINNHIFDYELEGKNGKKANRVSAFQAQTMLGNKTTKKGQVNPYSMSADQLNNIINSADNAPSEEESSYSTPAE